jgi:hypothetical protein
MPNRCQNYCLFMRFWQFCLIIFFFNCLCNVGFLKNLFRCFYNCCNHKLQIKPIFEILTFNFRENFAKFPKKLMFFKSPISQHPLIGKFQNWVEMKVNYLTNKKNTQMDFSDNFHNIKNFVQVDHLEIFLKNLFIFSLFRSPKNVVGRKNFPIGKN